MTEEEWNEELRNEMLETVSAYILGELKLAKRDDEEILEVAVDRVSDDIPEEETPAFREYAKERLPALRVEFQAEQASWPEVTDCDRLDDVQDELQEDGILLWQASPCCDTCSHSELPDRIDAIEEEDPGFRDRCRGYAFFHDQALADDLLEDSHLQVYLSYGWFCDEGRVTQDEYRKQALAIGEEVRDALETAGLQVVWDGDLSKKILLHIDWKRRTRLT